MVDSRVVYTILVLMVVAQRIAELVLSRRNESWLREHGAVEVGAAHYRWMVLLHTSFLAACLGEVWLLNRAYDPRLAIVGVGILSVATMLRYWTIKTLGRRWTTRVICLPGADVVTTGPFRFLRHPNYLAVVTEILVLPLIHGAWLTASMFTALNLILLRTRVRVEEQALREHNDYPWR
jgi:methyltransferase